MKDRYAHFVADSASRERALQEGTTVTSVCGKVWVPSREPLGPPQPEVALGSSRGPEGAQGASGAESDHGGRGDGEGLG